MCVSEDPFSSILLQFQLALRAGNEKDVDEAADTVGCCSLRCEHIKLYEKLDDKEYVQKYSLSSLLLLCLVIHMFYTIKGPKL